MLYRRINTERMINFSNITEQFDWFCHLELHKVNCIENGQYKPIYMTFVNFLMIQLTQSFNFVYIVRKRLFLFNRNLFVRLGEIPINLGCLFWRESLTWDGIFDKFDENGMSIAHKIILFPMMHKLASILKAKTLSNTITFKQSEK